MAKENLTLREQLLLECDAMAKHAFSSGKAIPQSLAEQIEIHLHDQAEPLSNASDDDQDRSVAAIDASQRAVTKLADLTLIHQGLSTIVAPATPRTILLLAREAKSSHALKFLGPVPLVRHMMVVSLISLLALILITLSSEVNEENMAAGLTHLDGIPLLIIELLYVSAAASGASFAALFTANRYVVEGTFDPKYAASYWVRFTLGIIAGVILADFVPMGEDGSSQMHKPLLAILGGFSAALVYQILSRLVETVESVFQGNPRDRIAANVTTAKIQAEAQATLQNATVAKRLIRLHSDINSGTGSQQIGDQVNQLLNDLIPTDLSSQSTSQPAPPDVNKGSGKVVDKRKSKS